MKPNYDLILLDADGTLMDFVRAQDYALTNMLLELGLPVDKEILALYDSINIGYWALLEQGKVTKSELVLRRFEDLLHRLNAQEDVVEMNSRFLHYLGEADFLLSGAEEICAVLAPHCTLAIATNGVVAAQTCRLQKSALVPYISHLIVSEMAGAVKPEKQFYNYAFEICGFPDKSRVLMVGDSLAADMRGGVGYGIDTCWYNPAGLPLPEDLAVTYEIDVLSDLAEIVLGQQV